MTAGPPAPPVTAETITHEQIRSLRRGAPLDLEVAVKRALGADVGTLQGFPPSSDEVAAGCAAAWNAIHAGKELESGQ